MKLAEMGRNAQGRIACAAFVAAVMLATAAYAADIYWVGGTGTGKSWNTAANWDLARVPAWGDTVHITNAVSMTFSGDLRANAIRVSGGNVSFALGGNRWYAGNANNSSTIEIWVDEGRTLTWSGTYMIYGGNSKTFVKSGGGTLTIPVGIGNPNDNNYKFGAIEIREGVLNHTSQYNAIVTRSTLVLKIGALGTYKMNHDSQTVNAGMVIDIAEGGTLDLCSKSNARTFRGLTGGGRVINNSGGLTLRGEGSAANSSGTFSGKLSGTVTVAPQNGNALIVGAADTLSNCTLNVTWPATGKTPLKFASGIGSFFVKAIPDIDVWTDVDGQPIDFVLPGRHWYVDPSRETSGDGTSLATAFKAFTNAFAVAVSGDTVWTAPGTYSTETVKDGDNIDCRLNIPAGVKVRAIGSAADTIIDGGNVARCVYMRTGSHLAGFTVQNGFASNGKSGGGVATDSANSITAYVVDCVIKNNKAAYRSGEVVGSGLVFYRCKFLGNSQSTAGQGTEKLGSMWSCYVNGYEATQFWYGAASANFRNCTFGEKLTDGGLRTNYGNPKSYNGVFLMSSFGSANSSGNKLYYYGCLFSAAASRTNVYDICDAACEYSVSKASILDSSYKPIATGAAVDTGTSSYYSLPVVLSQTYGDTDLAGLPRKMNGAIDIGAYEYDWRPMLGNALAKGLVIDDISGGVTTNETGLSMSTNDRIVLRYGRDRNEVGTYSFSASVDGTGYLRVYDGGTNLVCEIDSAAATDTYTVESDKALSLTFVFRGDGTASLSNFKKPAQGLMFIFR